MNDMTQLSTLYSNAIARAEKAEEALRKSEWQPIETAPTGAKGMAWMLLAYGPEGDQTTGMGMRFHDKFYAASSFYVGGHFESRQYQFREHEVHPTHWMEVPALPPPPPVRETP
jgi:hypothetical protein